LSYTHGWIKSCESAASQGFCKHSKYGDVVRRHCPVSCDECPPEPEAVKAEVKKLPEKKRVAAVKKIAKDEAKAKKAADEGQAVSAYA
jgi:hypothetical protein